MAEIRVARATPSDWSAYRDIRLAMLLDTPRAFASTYAETSLRTDEEWREFVANAYVWLAYAADEGGEAGEAGAVDQAGAGDQPGEGERPVGSVGMWAAPDLPPGSVFLVGMWVAPDARRRGVGTALVLTVMQAARDAGFERMVLDVADENADAARLYEQMGFLPTGVAGVLPSDDTITEHQRAAVL